jgi:hypothetical protein
MQLIVKGVGLGNVSAVIEVRNKSKRDCDMYGYAGFQLLGSFRQPMPTKVIRSTLSYFSPKPAVAEVVALPSGRPPLTSKREVPGHAYIPIAFNHVQDPCVNAAFLQVMPPDDTRSLVISVVAPGERSASLYVCSAGSLIVSPTRAAVPA